MKASKNMVLTVAALAALSGCAQSEQSSEAPLQGSETPTQGGAGTGSKSGVYEGTLSGVIGDSMCQADHSVMGELGKDPVACTQECVEGGAKYVLVDTGGEVYSLSDQKLEEHAGRKVKVSGHIDPQTKVIHVHSVVSQ